MTASPPGPCLRLHHCRGYTMCQHVSHLQWSCVRSKGWENMAPKPTFGTSEDLEIHGLLVSSTVFRMEAKGGQELPCQDRPQAWWGLSSAHHGYGMPPVPTAGSGPSLALPTPVASGENVPNVSKVISSYFLVASHVC